MNATKRRIDSYEEFWNFYVTEHTLPLTRFLHFLGTSLGVILLILFLIRGNYSYIPLCFVVGYGFAWGSHFFVEKNKPATFQYPFWSFISDYKMMYLMLIGKMSAEVQRVSNKSL